MTFFLWIFFFQVLQYVSADFKVDRHDLRVVVGHNESFNLNLTNKLSTDVYVTFNIQHEDLLKVNPATINITKNERDFLWNISVITLLPGHSVISTNVTPGIIDFSNAFVRVIIQRSTVLYHLSNVVGWVYFVAWSISFYPQIYTNYQRKSVVGLSFDFLSFNFVGFFMYALFNIGLYWIPVIESEYYHRYPKSLNPVQMNDVFFSIHAFCATSLTIGQCFIYETGVQRVSNTTRIIHGLFAIFIVISTILGIIKIIEWLDFLYFCSYIKLIISLIKYIPQAYSNYKRKSTVGWSIGNIILDFTGGSLSMLQMVLNAYNYDDWESIFGDPTKFGLGFISVIFDIFFLLQHYVFYKHGINLLDSDSIVDVLA
ncbi:cystinosin homolog [Microplitis mediator]|uniref:cystinosin homolog n=1 Tax=Microplitis mediator TaxID=375433 RepID=UPI002555E037|nr:cystinosin homolog [Microplitis mediator]XP_057331630.1 cystinosin homolog [Microplitis mediator]